MKSIEEELENELGHLFLNQGFSTGQADPHAPGLLFQYLDFFHDIPHITILSLIEGVFSITPGASEVAARGADEDCGGPCEDAFALDGVEHLIDPDGHEYGNRGRYFNVVGAGLYMSKPSVKL